MNLTPIIEDERIVCREGKCEKCRRTVSIYGSDTTCDCGAIYNAFGQRLRDDLYSRPNRSEWDDECDDMTGYEEAYADD